MINVVCTNVPGPREPRYILGRRIVAIHPVVPLFEGLGLGFAILSYADQLSIAASADPALVPDVETVTDAIAAELDALVACARPRGASRPCEAPLPACPRVADLMTAVGADHRPETSLAEAWRLMRRMRIRQLPVVDDAASTRRHRHAPRSPRRHAERTSTSRRGGATAPASSGSPRTR